MAKSHVRFEYLIMNVSIAVFSALSMAIFRNNLEAGGLFFLILLLTTPCHILVARNIKLKGAVIAWAIVNFVLTSGVGSVADEKTPMLFTLVFSIYFLSAAITLFALLIIRGIDKKKFKPAR